MIKTLLEVCLKLILRLYRCYNARNKLTSPTTSRMDWKNLMISFQGDTIILIPIKNKKMFILVIIPDILALNNRMKSETNIKCLSISFLFIKNHNSFRKFKIFEIILGVNIYFVLASNAQFNKK